MCQQNTLNLFVFLIFESGSILTDSEKHILMVHVEKKSTGTGIELMFKCTAGFSGSILVATKRSTPTKR